MELQQGIAVSEDFFQILFPIIFTCRLFGLCPITYRKKGSNIVLMWSMQYCVYSYILAVLLASFTIYGIMYDLRMGKHTIRMSNDKGKYITICDISIVVVTVLFIIFSQPFTFKKFWRALDCLVKIDSILPFKKSASDRRLSIVLLASAAILYGYITAFDIFNWNKRSTQKNSLLKNYTCFYVLYFIIITQELYYCHLLLSIRRRYKTLNTVLKEFCNDNNNATKHMEKYFGMILVGSEKFGNNTVPLRPKEEMMNKSADLVTNKGLTSSNVRELSRVHELIAEAIQNVNSSCGISVLLVMMSCLLHLIVTPYFFLMEIHTGTNTVFAILQFSWIIIHLLRLLLIIEPCQACLLENQTTIALVCKLLTHGSRKENRTQLAIFAMQLSFCKVEFTSCGLVNINRSIITTIAGAVTTYMVILFQFKDD